MARVSETELDLCSLDHASRLEGFGPLGLILPTARLETRRPRSCGRVSAAHRISSAS
jgi:hypothetical protein